MLVLWYEKNTYHFIYSTTNYIIEFFKDNQDKIFESGNLAEGPWNDQLSKKIKSITNTKNAICVNSNGSGLVALLLIYKEYYGRTDVMIQSNTMYGVKTMVCFFFRSQLLLLI